MPRRSSAARQKHHRRRRSSPPKRRARPRRSRTATSVPPSRSRACAARCLRSWRSSPLASVSKAWPTSPATRLRALLLPGSFPASSGWCRANCARLKRASIGWVPLLGMRTRRSRVSRSRPQSSRAASLTTACRPTCSTRAARVLARMCRTSTTPSRSSSATRKSPRSLPRRRATVSPSWRCSRRATPVQWPTPSCRDRRHCRQKWRVSGSSMSYHSRNLTAFVHWTTAGRTSRTGSRTPRSE